MKFENYMSIEFPSKSANEAFARSAVACFASQMDPTLEEFARIAGAKQWHVIRTITLPLTIPAISSGTLLVLIKSLSNYGIPRMVGSSKNIFTLPTKIVDLVNRAGGDFQGIREATALSVVLVIVAAYVKIVKPMKEA